MAYLILIILIILILIPSYAHTNDIWKNSQKIRNSININEYTQFHKLDILVKNYYGWKKTSSFTAECDILINRNKLILLPSAWKFQLFNPRKLPLPITIEKNIKPKIKINSFNEIFIKLENGFSLYGTISTEYIVLSKNTLQKEALIDALKDWY